ncbi:hypothetical protein [Streptosporangium carneum]|uniref:Secreted protein n=1 Tax=Streptosporangium carneum TaxID=47481 RepID=A0A9W6I4G8_9ACTN|nr:hypothetical protein [Streptosporangium carneum]GLK11881.1 hypothetical protein GCM10017600_52890 [Streptosporangium carneum]
MRTYGNGTRARVVLLVLVALLTLGGRSALADGAPTGEDLHVAQTLGARELSVVLRRVDEVPGPLRVDVLTHVGTAAGALTLRLTPTGVSARADGLPPAGSVVSEGELVLGSTPGSYGTTLRVDRPGPWELTVDDGRRSGRIPFIVPAPVRSPPDLVAYSGFSAAGGLLLVALGVAVWSRRWWPPLIPACGVVAAVAVGVTGASLSPLTPLPPQPGLQIDATVDNVAAPYSGGPPPAAGYSRPPVNMLVRASKASAGRSVDLDLLLSDGSTGRPVDDLLVHDDALIHLLVVSPSGRLWHLHPVQAGPGHYQVSLVAAEPGHYAISAELARRGGGVQLIRSATGLDVGEGLPTATALPAPKGLGSRDVDGIRVDLAASTLSAGVAGTITARIGETADLQPWLGMVGHLIVVGPLPDSEPVGVAAESAPIWSHVHAMAAVPRGVGGRPDETVAAFGPVARFTHTFPAPGRYRLWVQAERNHSLMTVPAVLDITAPEEGGRPSP